MRREGWDALKDLVFKTSHPAHLSALVELSHDPCGGEHTYRERCTTGHLVWSWIFIFRAVHNITSERC